MKVKKLVSFVLCLTMLATSIISAGAETAPANNDFWNYSLVSDTTKNMYLDFPMMIDKTLGRDMSLSIQLQYLKNISAGDSVSLEIRDLSDNSLVDTYQLSAADDFINWENVENDKNFSLTLSETLSGVTSQYIGYIRTKFIQADFPVDMSLGSVEYNNNNGETFSSVAMKKVGVHATCQHDEDEPCVASCKTSGILQLLTPSELGSFYNSLDDNCYYEMQTEAEADGTLQHYQGFISTYPGGENLGIFTPGYSFTTSSDFMVSPASMGNSGISTLSFSPDDVDFSTAFEYRYYENEYVSDLDIDTNLVVKWVVPEDGSYTIETIGNVNTMWYEFSANPTTGVINTAYSARYSGGSGTNAGKTSSILEGQIKYFVLNSEDGEPGYCAFRIKRNNYSNVDGIPSYRDEAQANYDNGIFSPIVNSSCEIEYDGDVNVFTYHPTAGIGYLRFGNLETKLSVELYTPYEREGGLDKLWSEGSMTIELNQSGIPIAYNFSNEIYYIEVKQVKTLLPAVGSNDYFDGNSYSYSFNFYEPRLKDAEDVAANPTYGDSGVYPTVISLPYNNESRTLHRGDSDYFKFTTGSDGGSVRVRIYKTSNGYQYDPNLYDEIEIYDWDNPEWSEYSCNPTITTYTDRKEMTYANLLPNHDYYIGVFRPDSSTYSSAHPYTIEVDLANPTANLSGNVTLTHTAGEDITSTSAFKNTVVANMSCYLYGEPINIAQAVANVELYYNDSVLTPAVVNGLTAGTYTIVPKYYGVAAVGGTVQLVVASGEAEDEIIMLENFQAESIDTEWWDWAVVARIVANTRLVNKGLPPSTSDVTEGILAVKESDYEIRGTRGETVSAANYFYSGSVDERDYFLGGNITLSIIETNLRSQLLNGKAVIMQLTSVTDPTNVNLMRYVVLRGMNLTTREYIIYEPFGDQTLNVSIDALHSGGYNGNSDLRFTGQIVYFADFVD